MYIFNSLSGQDGRRRIGWVRCGLERRRESGEFWIKRDAGERNRMAARPIALVRRPPVLIVFENLHRMGPTLARFEVEQGRRNEAATCAAGSISKVMRPC